MPRITKETLANIRALLLTVMGCVAVVLGLVNANAEHVMLGFAVLGGEPVYRAANGGP